jgi:hypothetical protein
MRLLGNLTPLRRAAYFGLLGSVSLSILLQFLGLLPELYALLVDAVAIVSLFVSAFADDDNEGRLKDVERYVRNRRRRQGWRRKP